ncbi:uncharacterized protein LOC123542687 [Mercenaria mercenaria]|uniref:uncharacterized protein LOC123542687 n=1 Tax=Mercenaria mercenaria TaxID=6596 RepID=UPI00234EA57B|nr:uncharacterized protein LOC123542687 [Mercenaria mercenaria]
MACLNYEMFYFSFAQELNDLLSCFGLTDQTNIGRSAATYDTDTDIDEVQDVSIESRLQRYYTATPLAEEYGNESENQVNEDTNVNSEDPQCDINNVKTIYDSGCKCTKNCFSNFTFSQIESNILNVREMTKSEKEMLIMGTLKRIISDARCKGNRKRSRYEYVFEGVTVCHETFLVVFDIKDRQLRNIKHHMEEHGAQPRVHGHSGRRAPNAFPPEVIKDAVQYILSYANEEGLPQPAAPRGREDEAPIYLPSSDTKQSVHSEYVKRCMEAEKRYVGLTTFKDIWKNCLPHIKIASPKEDVCKVCEDCKQDIKLAMSENDKILATQKYHNHVLQARKERELYVECVERSTAMFVNRAQQDQAAGDGFSTDDVHYTFDFSQYVKLPHHAQEKGPTFFIQPRRVQIFGFRADGYKQYNYLIDEDQTIDGQNVHGPDSVISMIDHAFHTFGTGETECGIHADNCFGQNKNRYVLAYLSWRTMTGRHRTIRYMMQLPGHTRCLIDAGFGTIKKLYRRSNCDTLQHVVDVVHKSAHSNVPVTYDENGWKWRDWKMFLGDRFKKVPNISKYYHFRFTSSEPGVVYMKVAADDTEEIRFVICKTNYLRMDTYDLPSVIRPAGLSKERQTYLYRHVRPLVRRPFQDVLCPPPASDD